MRKRRSALTQGLLFSLVAAAASGETINPPKLTKPVQFDYERLGDLIFAGNFEGISEISYEGQLSVLNVPDSKADDLLFHFGSDVYEQQSFLNGRVNAGCMLHNNSTAVLAGDFTEAFNSTLSSQIVAVDLLNRTVTQIPSPINGSQINTLWCNSTEVYAGGSFEYNGSTGVAVWNSQNNSWSLPAFGGFAENSEIHTIIPYNDSIIFGGNFSGISLNSGRNRTTAKNSSNLLNPGMQPVSFSLANATGYSSASDSQGDPGASAVLCPFSQDANGWRAAEDSTTGYINVTLAYMSQPTRIRLFNLADGSGTKAFRIISNPAGSFMNLTYTDEEGKEQSCSASCPLLEYSDKIRHSDFKFVNVVPTSSMKIELLDFYGDHAGLKGIQLFEQGQFAFAYNVYNDPRSCGSTLYEDGDVRPTKSATTNLEGDTPWVRVNDFMATNITDKSKFNTTYAQMDPAFDSYAVNKGSYEVLLYTPGCKAFGNCKQRGQVNVTVFPGFGSPVSTVLYQTNEDLKYDQVYNGTLEEGSYIRITPTDQNNVPMNLVAYKVSLNYLGVPEHYNVSRLFEYSVSNFTSTSAVPVGKTPINLLGKRLGSNSSVNSLLLNGTSTLLVGGSGFNASNTHSNLLALDLKSSRGSQGVPGIDKQVKLLYNANGTTIALSSDRAYTLENSEEGAQVINGTTSYDSIVPFSFNGTEYWVFSPTNLSNSTLTVWNEQTKQVVARPPFSLRGHFSGSFTTNNATVYLGSAQLADILTPGGVAIVSDEKDQNVTALNVTFENETPSISKRDTASQEGEGGSAILAGTYLNSFNIVLVGNFSAKADNSTALSALLVTQNGTHPLFRSGDTDFTASQPHPAFYFVLPLNNSSMAIGGDFTGKVYGTEVGSLLVYDADPSLKPTQPKPLNPGRSVTIKRMALKPNSSSIIVGGEFSSADGVSNATCHGLCMYEFSKNEWTLPGGLESIQAGSVINDLVFSSGKRLVIAGNLSLDENSNGQVASLDLETNKLDMLPSLPGSVDSIVSLSDSRNESVYVASGDQQDSSGPFVKWYSGSDWQDVPDLPLLADSKISALATVILQNTTASTNSSTPFNSTQALLVSGNLRLKEGSASVIVFDGSQWNTVYATVNSESGAPPLVRTVFSQYGGQLNGGVLYTEGTGHKHPRDGPMNGNKSKKHMPVGHVVGIACAIGVCCVLVIMMLYIAAEFLVNGINRGPVYQNLAQSKPDSDGHLGTKIVK